MQLRRKFFSLTPTSPPKTDDDGQADLIIGDLQDKNGKGTGGVKQDVVLVVNAATGETVVFPVFTSSSNRRAKPASPGNSCNNPGNGVPPHCVDAGDTTTDTSSSDDSSTDTTVDDSSASTDDSASSDDNSIHGVNVFAEDINCDGKAEIIAAMASKGCQVEVYSIDGSNAQRLSSFTAFDSCNGVQVTAGNVLGGEEVEIIAGQANGNLLGIFDHQGNPLGEFSTASEGAISSLAVTGGAACGIRPVPADTVTEISETLSAMGFEDASAVQSGGEIAVEIGRGAGESETA